MMQWGYKTDDEGNIAAERLQWGRLSNNKKMRRYFLSIFRFSYDFGNKFRNPQITKCEKLIRIHYISIGWKSMHTKISHWIHPYFKSWEEYFLVGGRENDVPVTHIIDAIKSLREDKTVLSDEEIKQYLDEMFFYGTLKETYLERKYGKMKEKA